MSNLLTSLATLLQSYLHWLSSLSGELATLILLIAFVVLAVIELNYPKRKLPLKKLRQSYQTNVSLFIFNSIVISLLSAIPLILVARLNSGAGLLSFIDNPGGKALLSLLLLDLLMYFWHRASHHFDGLWMFHKVHHNDPYLNVSTAFRIHIVELLILTLVKTVFILVTGISQVMVTTSETILTLFIMFHDTNTTFSGEKGLGQVIIAPYLHRAHHSVERKEHDTNYGAIFSIWDRLFGTFAEYEPAKIGIKNSSPQNFSGLLKFGFSSDKQVTAYEPDLNLSAMIAEAAYYKAEKRSFTPGNELRDWLEAKREIIRMVYGDKPGKKQSNSSDNTTHCPFTLC
ncbi:MAG: sterol desaturase family protein [Methylobacter sp.]|nr:sterol desaturase family protein [Methylobacter sp.]